MYMNDIGASPADMIHKVGRYIQFGEIGATRMARDFDAAIFFLNGRFAPAVLKRMDCNVKAGLSLPDGHVTHERFDTAGCRRIVFAQMKDLKRSGHGLIRLKSKRSESKIPRTDRLSTIRNDDERITVANPGHLARIASQRSVPSTADCHGKPKIPRTNRLSTIRKDDERITAANPGSLARIASQRSATSTADLQRQTEVTSHESPLDDPQ
jgi:hypothetical protein